MFTFYDVWGVISFPQIIKSLTYGGTVIEFSWYLQTIMILYILFWVIYSSRYPDDTKLIFVTAANVVFCVINYILCLSTAWYATSICFFMGLLWKRHKTEIDKILMKTKMYFIWILLSIIFPIVIYAVAHLIGGRMGEVLQVMGTSLFFSVAIIVMLTTLSINNIVTQYLGLISFEIYVMQGIMFIMVGAFKSNIALYAVVIMMETILLASVFHLIVKRIFEIARNKT